VELLLLLHLYLIEISKYKILRKRIESAETREAPKRERNKKCEKSLSVKETKSARSALAWEFLTYINPLPDGPLASPLTNGPRSDWTQQKTHFDDVS
jgi:hypothetical protein